MTHKSQNCYNKTFIFIVLDSWGKIPSGLLVGNAYDLGNFDECYDINYLPKNIQSGYIQGQYCLIKVEVPFGDE